MILFGDGDIEDHLTQNYPFHIGWMSTEKASVTNGVWRYEGDKPLRPIAEFVQGNKTINIYPYAIVAVLVDNVLTKWSRCD